MCRTRSRPASRQFRPTSRLCWRSCWNCCSVLGNNVVSGVITGSVQRTCELFAMPRGSMPTRSNRSIRAGVKMVSAMTMYFAAPSPGPPGLKKSVPTRCCGSWLVGARSPVKWLPRRLRPIKRHLQGAALGLWRFLTCRPGDLEACLTRISRGLSATDDQEQRGKRCNAQDAQAES